MLLSFKSNFISFALISFVFSCSEKETSYRREYESGRDASFNSFVLSCSEKETSYRPEYEAGRDVSFDSFVCFRYELIMYEYYMFKLCMIMICIIRFSRGPKTLPLISTIDMSPDGNSYLT